MTRKDFKDMLQTALLNGGIDPINIELEETLWLTVTVTISRTPEEKETAADTWQRVYDMVADLCPIERPCLVRVMFGLNEKGKSDA